MNTYRFSLRGLLLIVSLVALHLALMKSYVLVGPSIPDAITHAHQVAALFAGLANFVDWRRIRRVFFGRSMIVGFLAAFVVASAIMLEVAVSLYYFYDFDPFSEIQFVVTFIGWSAFLGSLVGLVLATIARGSLLLFGPSKRSSAPPLTIRVRDLP